VLGKQLDFPKGDPRNPLTDQDVEEKFAALAEGVLSAGAQKRLKEAIWNLENSNSVGKLMALMKADIPKTPTEIGSKARSRANSKKKAASV